MKTAKNICVIGAGINGLSTAVILLKSGYQVTIISKDQPLQQTEKKDFASTFPSASIIPHTIYSDEMTSLFRKSQDYFKELHDRDFPGLSVNDHYELFAEPVTPPQYLSLMKNTELFIDFKKEWHPSHPKEAIHSGWKFSCYFADWSIYYEALLVEFFELGGKLELRELQRDDINNLPWQIIINCSGLGSVQLFNDTQKLLYRGHLLHLPGMPLLKNPCSNNVVSYNISPAPNTLVPVNKSFDVYCYPRSDGWILGGSRQKGTISEDGEWMGEETEFPVMRINNLECPAYILQLNKEIIEHSFNVQVGLTSIKIKTGYRFARSEKNGLKISSEYSADKMIIHNYGHGGAGVTLSWGCALKVASLLDVR